ncbi:zinc-binding dehydrogenase [Mechercharimyces sp. CAU 1602]|uniref:quinone oxidoreductase family protein n=1 Tax=Mechercharimyces sp. CAU 1602 TaxID=2973933 RepID=UPI00216325EA|nr:zinc-binding dehydrogenase [Mechercharimyces sp. CAU 1602]MCS1351329.1 zinc-binding dehydrogenase [Mechercharimyces sp. CAU 1602]
MKAIVIEQFGGPEVLRVCEIEKPQVGAGEVLIRVANTSVNFADIKNRTGKKARGLFPLILGLDVAGVVEELGEGVVGIKRGQRVVAFPKEGAYAEYVVAEAVLTFPIPDQVSMRVAAACPTVSFLSLALLRDVARIEPGESVLIHAASGGVGTTAIQLAKYLGARKVIGTVSNLGKAAVVRESGADHVCTYDNFSESVNKWTEGKGVDIVLDSIAGSVTEESMECVAPYGRIVHFGNSGGEAGKIQTNQLHASCRSILGFSLGTTRKKRPHLLRKVADEVFTLLIKGALEIRVGNEYPLEDIADAHRLIEERKHIGKVLLRVDETIA